MTKKYCLIPIIAALILIMVLYAGDSRSSRLKADDHAPGGQWPMPTHKPEYDKLWKQVEKFSQEGLPKSAGEVVEKILSSARRDKLADQLIKALIYKLQYLQEVEEGPFKKIHEILSAELKIAVFPVTPILHSMMAEQYWSYYQQNRHRFLSRTSLEVKPEDVETWDLKALVETVIAHYRASVEERELLCAIPVETFDVLIIRGNVDRRVRPTLYDFLAHRAIQFFMNGEAGVIQPANTFSLHREEYFAPAREFAALEIKTPDPLSFHYYALSGLQELIRFHQESGAPEALLDADLIRLRFLFDQAVVSNRTILYETRLTELMEQYGKLPACALAYYERAMLCSQLGDDYKATAQGPGRDNNKWLKKKALEICREAITKFPGAPGAVNCKNLEAELTSPFLSLTLERVISPDTAFAALTQYKNLTDIHLRVVKTDREEKEFQKSHYSEAMLDLYTKKDPVRQWREALPQENDYQFHYTEIKADGLPEGEYILLASESPEFRPTKKQVAWAFFTISHIAYLQAQNSGEGLKFYTARRDTGQPLPGVKLQTWTQQYDNAKRAYVKVKNALFQGDREGFIPMKVKGDENRYFFLEFIDGDSHLFVEDGISYYDYSLGENRSTRTWFFTDRAIYRPGQTVHFKGLTLDQDGRNTEKTKIIADFPVTAVLNDGNGQKVAELILRTNKYGTFSGTFQLPLGRMTGQWSITDGYGRAGFSVEEYKRPKFEVVFPDMTETYKLKDTVKMKGKAAAFAGYSLSGAQVRFRVMRKVFYPFRWYYWYDPAPETPAMEIVNGVMTTDDKGEFEIAFPAIPDLTIPEASEPAFSFTVHADVTDINGETRSGEKVISIGYKALLLQLGIPEKVNLGEGDATAPLSTTTLDGAFIPAPGHIDIYMLETPERIFREKYWPEPDLYLLPKEKYISLFPHDPQGGEALPTNWKKKDRVFSRDFDTGKEREVKLAGLKNWRPGKYLAELVAQDRYGTTVKSSRLFTVFSPEEGPPPYKMLSWVTPLNHTVEPGGTASLLIGSSAENVHGFYEIQFRDKITELRRFILNNEQKRIDIPIREEHRGNIGIHVVFIRYNRRHEYRHTVNVPWTNKNLEISFETFRDKLNPGEKEEWRIRIRDKKGGGFAAAAEMAAVLYDASLDAFVGHQWSFTPFTSYAVWERWLENNYFGSVGTVVVGPPVSAPGVISRSYDYFNWFGFYLRVHSRMRMMAGAIPPPSPAAESAMMDGAPAPKMAAPGGKRNGDSNREEAKDMKMAQKPEPEGKGDAPEPGAPAEGAGAPPVKARTNFQETAFFYPHLISDDQGVITIAFTIPEALTRWKMMGFAHTTDLKHNIISRQLATQKDLMVEPNAPRFFREGDTLELTAKITNLSGNTLNGKARLQLLDAATLDNVDALFLNTQPELPFTVEKERSIPVRWKITVPETVDAVTYRITAQAGRFSDGEEKPAPVLKNRTLVTESLPLPLRSKETKSFTFDKLTTTNSPTLRHHRLTMEFTANPVWYAVQALPYLMEFPYECMEQLFSRYYANSIAAFVVNSNQGIKRVFDIWRETPGSGALLSNLEKNQELKSIVLEETPWVMNAANESERKKRVALLFDLNLMAAEKEKALNKLKEGQLPSGGWSWFKGMTECRYITQHIVGGFAHLHRLNVVNISRENELRDMLNRAIVYLDEEMLKAYNWLMKNVRDPEEMHIGYTDIHYLYVRSYFRDNPIAKGSETEKAFNYYKKQAEKYWVSFHGYMQGMIALALNRYGNGKTAQAIVKSLSEHALHSQEMGMYWKQDRDYFWYRAPIETQALLIEVYDEVANDAKAVDEMRLWLLKQKQTQDWGSTKATSEACYALLLRGSSWLGKTELPDITLGKANPLSVHPSSLDGVAAEAGTGYFKTSWNGGEIKPDMGYVTVKNNNQTPAWGSLYWQYFENLDKITAAETPLKLEKKLFAERMSDRGPVLKDLASETLSVGDRVKVRIILRADRDMEYVHMKDLRASGFEPEDVLSTYHWRDGLGYFQSTRDTAVHFFFAWLPKGVYVFEYNLRVNHAGDFSNGITTIQCMYAPEFSAHSEGVRVKTSSGPGL